MRAGRGRTPGRIANTISDRTKRRDKDDRIKRKALQDGAAMKEINMLVWITQLGVSVAAPLGGFTLLGLWLRERFGLGLWAMLLCVALGMIGAVSGLRQSLKIMEQMDRQSSRKDKKKETPPVSFNEHE